LQAQNLALEKTPGLGSRIDITLTIVRLGFFFSDTEIVTTNMDKAEKCVYFQTPFLFNSLFRRLIDEGGDWDRRNRLKVYNGLHLLSIRQFKRGGELLLDALSTFTATELLSYNEFVGLTVIANTLGLKRVDLKKKVRDCAL
jgi:26S proteasome regulatory subunit N7